MHYILVITSPRSFPHICTYGPPWLHFNCSDIYSGKAVTQVNCLELMEIKVMQLLQRDLGNRWRVVAH